MVASKYRGVLFLSTSAAVIVALCLYKLNRTYDGQSGASPVAMRPARPFELLDSSTPSQMFRLDSYRGRHQIVLVFFDGAAGADQDPYLLRLRDQYGLIEANETFVVAVSTALPQHNRAVFERIGEFPFPLLSDPGLHVHKAWGRYDEEQRAPLPGLFVIDRKGDVAYADGVPQPIDDVDAFLEQLAPEG